MQPTDFAQALSTYLSAYLPGQKNASPHTIHSYRDTFKLLLNYCQCVRGLAIERLSLRDLDDQLIVGFLEWLETERQNQVATRNQRLACIHAFYRYLQTEDPAGLWSYQKILALPMKKTPRPVISHLTPEALKMILDQPDRATRNGRRDATLLAVLYDTGARVQELLDLRVRDIRLEPPPILTLTGKGNKTRQVPLMSPTTKLLKQYLDEWRLVQNGTQDYPVFFNCRHQKMTRAGVAFILDKYTTQAHQHSVGIPEHITPHVLRHSKAMHLLQAGVNLVYIRDFMGHVDIATTEIYARADTELKRKALEHAYPEIISDEFPDWTKDDALLEWLNRL
jgi:site-specific recombinase XerD